MKLHALLGLPEEGHRVVSLCGAGGKTSLMLALARETRQAAPTALFTTTHILAPEGEDIVLSIPFSEAACRSAWDRGRIAAAGEPVSPGGKLAAPPEDAMIFLCREAAAVFIEADGSRRLPVKFPAPWEPVLRPETTHIVVVAGLSALGRPAEETVHRLALAREAQPVPDGPLEEETMADILWAGYGRYDPVFFLNQADTPALEARGRRVAQRLRALGAGRVEIASLRAMGSL